MQELITHYTELYKDFNYSIRKRAFFKKYINRTLSRVADESSTNESNFSELFKFQYITDLEETSYFEDRRNLIKDYKKHLKKNLLKEIFDPEIIRSFNRIFLNESLQCLDRSIYWFLNYCRNLDGSSLNANIQNLYYSEFFIHLSIGRFLGLAYTWVNELDTLFKIYLEKSGNYPTKSFEKNLKINVALSDKGGGMHNLIYVQTRYHIRNHIDMPESTVSKWFEPHYIKSVLKKEREEYIYDISNPRNNPWDKLHERFSKEYRNLCFLEGFNHYDVNNGGEAEYIYSKYLDWGYREHHIGILIRWMANRLKDMNAEYKINQILTYLEEFDRGLYPESLEQRIIMMRSWFT